MQGQVSAWLRRTISPEPILYPSARCALEAALLSAVAESHSTSLAQLLTGLDCANQAGREQGAEQGRGDRVAISGLLSSQGPAEECADEAQGLVAQGFQTLKVKVRERGNAHDIHPECLLGLPHLKTDLQALWPCCSLRAQQMGPVIPGEVKQLPQQHCACTPLPLQFSAGG